jgi:hypothetical protein
MLASAERAPDTMAKAVKEMALHPWLADRLEWAGVSP